ncbi:MAG: cell division protein ZapA [Lachnospiraceae bacterium]|nr:cell division protein ZapA [Lachnospiraceae bacterium]
MKSMNDTDVLIDGRKYTICGFESDEYLQQIASYINRKFTEFRKKDYYRRLDLDLRNVLLAINIADDYHKAKRKVKELQSEGELKDKMVLEMKHEIIDLQEQAKKDEEERKKLETSLEKAEKRIIELETRLKQKK